MDDNTIICRVKYYLGEIRMQLDKGYSTLDEIKRITRAGMGPCQENLSKDSITRHCPLFKQKVEDIPLSTFRPPTKPVPLGILAGGQDDRSG